MRPFWFLFKLFLLAAGLAFLCLAGFAAVLLWRPAWIVNPFVLGYLKDNTVLGEYVSWKDLDVEIQTAPDWRRSLRIKARDLCLKSDDINGCLDVLKAEIDFSLPIQREFRIHRLGPLTVDGVDMRLQLPPADDDAADPAMDPVEVLRKALKIEYAPMRVRVDALTLLPDPDDPAGKPSVISGDFEFGGLDASAAADNPALISFNVRQSGHPDWQEMKGAIEIGGLSRDMDSFDRTEVTVDVRARHQQGTATFKAGVGALAGEQRALQAAATYDVDGTRLGLNVKGDLGRERWRAVAGLEAKSIAFQQLGVSITPCHLDMALKGQSPLNGFSLDIDCRGRGDRQPLTRENVVGLFVPSQIQFGIGGNVDFVKEEQGNRIESHLSLSVDRVVSELYTLDGQFLFDGVTNLANPESSRYDLRFSIGSEIQDFGKVVRRLERTELAVPAPFNQLQGEVTCDANGRFQSMADLNSFPVVCASRLASEGQKLNIQAEAQVSLRKNGGGYRPHVEADVLLDDILVTLPDLQITKPLPQFKLDPRFKALEGEEADASDLGSELGTVAVAPEPPAASDQRLATPAPVSRKANPKGPAEPSPVSYAIRVRTADDRLIQFKTELLPALIPLAVDLRLADGSPMAGFVAVRDLRISLFRRQAHIENVEISFRPGIDEQALTGKVLFPHKDYELGLELFGTLQTPGYNFFSNTPMEQQAVLAVLLFGEDPDQLDDENRRSVGDAQAALADGAIGLLSMYYLASTPVERIGYDPGAQVFTAKVRLRDDLSLTLGSDIDSRNTLGLRKSLGRNWSVETSAERDSETAKQKGTATLNWSKRF